MQNKTALLLQLIADKSATAAGFLTADAKHMDAEKNAAKLCKQQAAAGLLFKERTVNTTYVYFSSQELLLAFRQQRQADKQAETAGLSYRQLGFLRSAAAKQGGRLETQPDVEIVHTENTRYTERKLGALRKHYPDNSTAELAQSLNRDVRSLHQKALALGIKKSAAFYASALAGRIQSGKHNLRIIASRFKPGSVSWNTGLKGWSAPNSEATRFKPGGVPANRSEVGALRINSEDGIDIKLAEGMRQWVPMSHYNWFLAHGEWPAPGMVLRFRDGDRHNVCVSNLELLTRMENMKRNSLHTNYPPEVVHLVHLVQLRGALNRRINDITRNQ